MKKIFVTRWIPEECRAPYRGKYEIICPEQEEAMFSQEEIWRGAETCDALYCIGGVKCGKDLIDRTANARVIGNFGVGYDNGDVEYATQMGKLIINTPDSVTRVTAEHTIALMLSAARSIPLYDREVREMRRCVKKNMFLDRDMLIQNKVCGIVGFGRIGKAVAEMARGLGMKVVFYTTHPPEEEEQRRLGVKYLPFDELLREADVVSCHVPYRRENHHLFGREEFAKMKPSAYFINMARGPVMDERALAEALHSGTIRGAATDVFEFEPEVTKELAEQPNAVLTPHVGSSVREARNAMASEALAGIVSALEGKIPYNAVNPQAWS